MLVKQYVLVISFHLQIYKIVFIHTIFYTYNFQKNAQPITAVEGVHHCRLLSSHHKGTNNPRHFQIFLKKNEKKKHPPTNYVGG